MSQYRIHSWPAIAGGILAATGSCALLWADVGSWQNLTVDKAMMPLLVAITVLTGHLAWQAWRELKLLSVIGLAVVSCVGVAITVTEAMGRRAEVRDTKVADVGGTEKDRTRIQRKLAEAQEILDKHRADRDRECESGKGKKCDGKSYTAATWEAAVSGYEAKLKTLPAPRPVDAKGSRIAALAALAGYSPEAVQKAFGVLEPFALPAILELASIALFGFGIGHRNVSEVPPKVEETAANSRHAAQSPDAPGSRNSSGRLSLISSSRGKPEIAETSETVPISKVALVDDDETIIVGLRRLGGQAYSQRDLARAMNISPAEVSKRLAKCPHVERVRDDNRVVVRLRKN